MREKKLAKQNKKGNSVSLKYKKWRLLLSYYFRNLIKRIINTWPFILFILSFILFSFVLAPHLFLHRFGIIGEWPRILEIEGTVCMEFEKNGTIYDVSIVGAKIEIGGYSTFTDDRGNFHIKFLSKSYEDIPMIIRYEDMTEINRISFQRNQFIKKGVYVKIGK